MDPRVSAGIGHGKALSPSALIAASLTGLVWLAPTAHADPDPISVGAYLHTLNVLHVPYDNPGRIVDIGNNGDCPAFS